MRYSLTFCEPDFERLTTHLFPDGQAVEQGAYLLCRLAQGREDTRLLVREVLPVEAGDVEAASAAHMSIPSHSFLRAMKRADETRQNFVFVHSHPAHLPEHSAQDNREEEKLFRTAFVRIKGAAVHGSLVFSARHKVSGRVWCPDGTTARLDATRVMGNRFRFFGEFSDVLPDFGYFDRQVRAFGREIQVLLKRLTVGVVGAGGTGSAVIEQLVRLGVGHLIIPDGQALEGSNVSRVYGSGVGDDGKLKVAIQQDHAGRIGLGTKITAIPKDITFRSAIEELKACDLIFCCTDDQWGRALLTRFAIYYYIPVFDLGVKIDSADGTIQSAQGRVTTLVPGAACLFCRGRLSPEEVRAESLQILDPAEAGRLRNAGYAPELADPAPAVIPFTTAVAATAISELLHRLTGFLGGDRNSTEVLHLFDDTRIRTNSTPAKEDCFCLNRKLWGRGDTVPLLDSTWRPE